MKLIRQLNSFDRHKIKTFIKHSMYDKDTTFDFIGVDNYLKFWDKNKRKLFHILDNKLIVKKTIPFNNTEEINKKLQELYNDTEFIKDVLLTNKLINSKQNKTLSYKIKKNSSDEDYKNYLELQQILREKIKYQNDKSFNYKRKYNFNDKYLAINSNMKLIKIISTIIKFFEPILGDSYNSLLEQLEELRIEESKILNSKADSLTFTFSIHPLDFLTMSDNANDWSSCMSFMGSGCYRQGAIELLNSKNVVMCYIESSNKMDLTNVITKKVRKNTNYIDLWNSKKFRVFFIVDKDIIVSGKTYPFENESYATAALQELQKLVEKNTNWRYSKKVKDYTTYDALEAESGDYESYFYDDEAAEAVEKHHAPKIIIFSKGYYNDWYYNNGSYFKCVENLKNKWVRYLCISGPTVCPVCGKAVLEYNGMYDGPDNCYYRMSYDFCYRHSEYGRSDD